MFRRKVIHLLCWCLPAITITLCILLVHKIFSIKGFNEANAFEFIRYQVNLGPRIPGSSAHRQTRYWIADTMSKQGWNVEIQEGENGGEQIYNVIAKLSNNPPQVIIGAHYDSREFADRDETLENRKMPVEGANDGASGVAILLELGRIVPKSSTSKNIWLVFFDFEDGGGINGRDWILGSRYFVDQLDDYPEKVVILDMVGDGDLQIFQERNSDQELSNEIWATAKNLGYSSYFVGEKNHQIYDDHIPFIEVGIRAIDVIDFNYPYWHTIEDTIDKVHPNSLKVVGDTIYNWLLAQETGDK